MDELDHWLGTYTRGLSAPYVKRFAGIFCAVEFLLHYFQSTVIRFVACFIIYNTKPKPTKTKLGTYIPIDFFYREILICFKHYKNSLKLDSVPFSFNEIRQSNFKKCISVAFLCDFSIFYQSCGNWYKKYFFFYSCCFL